MNTRKHMILFNKKKLIWQRKSCGITNQITTKTEIDLIKSIKQKAIIGKASLANLLLC